MFGTPLVLRLFQTIQNLISEFGSNFLFVGLLFGVVQIDELPDVPDVPSLFPQIGLGLALSADSVLLLNHDVEFVQVDRQRVLFDFASD